MIRRCLYKLLGCRQKLGDTLWQHCQYVVTLVISQVGCRPDKSLYNMLQNWSRLQVASDEALAAILWGHSTA